MACAAPRLNHWGDVIPNRPPTATRTVAASRSGSWRRSPVDVPVLRTFRVRSRCLGGRSPSYALAAVARPVRIAPFI